MVSVWLRKQLLLPGQPFTSPPESLVFLTNRVARLIVKRLREEIDFEEHGLSPFHMGILADLLQKDGVRQQDLAISNIKDKATIARALDNLEQSAFLLREPDPRDKRTKRIFLTNKGRDLQEALFRKYMEFEQGLTERVSKEDLQTTRRVLRRIYEDLQP